MNRKVNIASPSSGLLSKEDVVDSHKVSEYRIVISVSTKEKSVYDKCLR